LVWVKPVARTLSDQVANAILERIARGELVPGSSLPPQRELSRELGVGLSVVREAIQRLQVLKVVRTRHGSGTVIENLRWNQIAFEPALHLLAMQPHLRNQIWEARYAIEKETMLLAAARASAQELKAILDVLRQATPPPTTFEENMRLNAEFHLAVARASHNSLLTDMLAPLLHIGFTTVPEVFDERSAEIAWDTHRKIYEGIAAHSADKTARALTYHMESGNQEIEKIKTLWHEGGAPNAVDETPQNLVRLTPVNRKIAAIARRVGSGRRRGKRG
jgi:DNA-binding FadR family transcriptional regulator